MIKNNKLSLLHILLIVAGIIWVFVLLGVVYNLPDIPTFTKGDVERVISSDTAAHPDISYEEGSMVPGVKLEEVMEANDELLAKGEESYKINCASCHGDKGIGDGVAGAMLDPKPRNFTDKDGWKNGRELPGLFKTLAEGIPNTGMSAYEFLPIQERFALIYYLRTLAEDFPPVDESEIKSIEDIYDITSDRKSGDQIPIAVAEGKVIQDHDQSIERAQLKLENSSGDAFQLFQEITENEHQALLTLSSNQIWKNDVQSLYKIITSNPIYNGFKLKTARLSKDEIIRLHGFLNTLFANI